MQKPTNFGKLRPALPVRTIVAVNGLLVLLTGIMMICFGTLSSLEGSSVYGLAYGTFLSLGVNGFMCFKALWQHEYRVAILFLLVGVGTVLLCVPISQLYDK